MAQIQLPRLREAKNDPHLKRAGGVEPRFVPGHPRGVRDQVNTLFGSFITDHIERRVSCAFETTLRSSITLEQAAKARQVGFFTEMRYIALKDFGMHPERVKMRAGAGGHSAPESLLKAIYESSINHLARAIREIDFIRVYDNSRWGIEPALLLQAEGGEIIYLAEDNPGWLMRILRQL